MKHARLHILAPLLALALLLGMGALSLTRPGPGDVEPYHAYVEQVANQIPYRVGDWLGEPVAAPPEAQQLLRPNVLNTINYTHAGTGQQAQLLFVHTREASDLAGHFPPNCYPAHGWTQAVATPRDWIVDGDTITGMRYEFTYQRPLGVERLVVDNFMIMPDGRFLRDTAGVYAAAADYTTRFHGAAQVQLLTPVELTDTERDAMFKELIAAAMPAINAVRFGKDQLAAGDESSPN